MAKHRKEKESGRVQRITRWCVRQVARLWPLLAAVLTGVTARLVADVLSDKFKRLMEGLTAGPDNP